MIKSPGYHRDSIAYNKALAELCSSLAETINNPTVKGRAEKTAAFYEGHAAKHTESLEKVLAIRAQKRQEAKNTETVEDISGLDEATDDGIVIQTPVLNPEDAVATPVEDYTTIFPDHASAEHDTNTEARA